MRASNQVSLYIDGPLRGAVASESDSGSFGEWTASPYIGARNDSAVDGPLTVRLAEIAWYDHQLSSARIITHYHALP